MVASSVRGKEALELGPRARILEIDRPFVERPRDGRQHVAADASAVEGQVADVGERGLGADDLPGGGLRLLAGRVVEVGRQRDEALDPERRQVLPRHPRVVLDEHDRLPACELERLAEHPFELQLVDELGQADEERDRAVAVADRAERLAVVPAQAPDVTLEDGAAADAVRQGR